MSKLQYILGGKCNYLHVCLGPVWRGGIPDRSYFTTTQETRVNKMTRPGDRCCGDRKALEPKVNTLTHTI